MCKHKQLPHELFHLHMDLLRLYLELVRFHMLVLFRYRGMFMRIRLYNLQMNNKRSSGMLLYHPLDIPPHRLMFQRRLQQW